MSSVKPFLDVLDGSHIDSDKPYNIEQSPYPLSETLEEIFSVLPNQKALEAQQLILKAFSAKQEVLPHKIHWADFDEAGSFKRGGVADVMGASFKVISDPINDDNVARLIAAASCNRIRPGSMEYSASENAIMWFVPNLIRTKKGHAQSTFRGIFLPEKSAHKLIDIFNGSALVTQAEKHLIFQLSAGMSLRSAAEADKLKVETKRSQLKSVCSKLDCNGQPDLLRHILGQFTYLLSLTDVQGNRSAELIAFADQHLPSDVRINEYKLSNDNIIRVIERGPVNGRGVIIIHGLLWPLILNSSLEELTSKNIRMIVPVRTGYIDKQGTDDVSGKNDLIIESLRDIALYQKEFLAEKMPVIGTSYGAAIALQYARKFPECVSKLFIVAIASVKFSSNNQSFLGRLYFGLKSLSNKPGIFRCIAWQYKKYYADEKTVQPILQKIYGSCKADLDLIDGKNGVKPFYPCFVDLFQKSISGIAEDFRFATQDVSKVSKGIEVDTLVIHGREDPMMTPAVAGEYIKGIQRSDIKYIEGAGHNMFNTHSKELWAIIYKAIT